jgi:hypothetical protein
MAIMTASAGERRVGEGSNTALKSMIHESIGRLSDWLEENDCRGYDTFDGLSARSCGHSPSRPSACASHSSKM